LSEQPPALPHRGRIARASWLVAVAVGSIGIVVPGLPTTVFFTLRVPPRERILEGRGARLVDPAA
jgi:hypothetical protein